MQETFDSQEDTKLEDLKFYSYKAVAIETKESGEEWEEYDPNAQHLKVLLWDYSKEGAAEEESQKGIMYNLSINRNSMLSELVEKISLVTKIDSEEIKIIKKSYSYTG